MMNWDQGQQSRAFNARFASHNASSSSSCLHRVPPHISFARDASWIGRRPIVKPRYLMDSHVNCLETRACLEPLEQCRIESDLSTRNAFTSEKLVLSILSLWWRVEGRTGITAPAIAGTRCEPDRLTRRQVATPRRRRASDQTTTGVGGWTSGGMSEPTSRWERYTDVMR